MEAQRAKKRRGFTLRDSDCKKPEGCLEEHQESKGQIGDRRSGLVKDRLISALGPGGYGELLKKLSTLAED